MPIICEAATHLTMLDFPAARPLVMDARRTFLEKAAAIHVACRRGRWGSGDDERYSRHWHDLDRLARAGIAEEANGQLQLVPTAAARDALKADYRAMTDSGMLRGEIPSFPELLERIALLEQQCNAIARSVS